MTFPIYHLPKINTAIEAQDISLEFKDLRLNEEPAGSLFDGDFGPYWQRDRVLEVLKTEQESSDDDDDDDDTPFFLYVAWQASHSPSESPEDLYNMYSGEDEDEDENEDIEDTSDDDEHIDSTTTDAWERRYNFQAQTTALDGAMEDVITYMKESGLWDNTIIVFSSDNGGESDYGDNAPLRGAKNTYWEGGIRVPGFITGGLIPDNKKGTTYDEISHVTDWYPTLMSFAGLDSDDSELIAASLDTEVDGINLHRKLFGLTEKIEFEKEEKEGKPAKENMKHLENVFAVVEEEEDESSLNSENNNDENENVMEDEIEEEEEEAEQENNNYDHAFNKQYTPVGPGSKKIGEDIDPEVQTLLTDKTAREIVFQVDQYDCEYTVCGAIRYGKYKLIIGGYTLYWNEDNLFTPFWDRRYATDKDSNDNVDFLQCGKAPTTVYDLGYSSDDEYESAEGEEATEATEEADEDTEDADEETEDTDEDSDIEMYSNNCDSETGCLFDIDNDPCEYNDLSNSKEAIGTFLKQQLMKYQDIGAVTPLGISFGSFDISGYDEDDNWPPMVDDDGYWAPFLNIDDYDNGELPFETSLRKEKTVCYFVVVVVLFCFVLFFCWLVSSDSQNSDWSAFNFCFVLFLLVFCFFVLLFWFIIIIITYYLLFHCLLLFCCCYFVAWIQNVLLHTDKK